MKINLRLLWGDVSNTGDVLYWINDTNGKRMIFNDLVGKNVKIRDTGERVCRICEKKVDSIYDKGACLNCFKNSPRCDVCMIKPEFCHFDKGTCRDEEFAKSWCFNGQFLYFSVTNDLKVGYMSKENKPQRWIDQGATRAIVFASLPNRKMAGELEHRISEFEKDKTNWSHMLKGKTADVNLLSVKNKWRKILKYEKWAKYITDDKEEAILKYPVMRYPEKISRIDLRAVPAFEDVLLGIRGQYLIFKNGVFSIRSHEGYVLDIESKEAEFINIAEQGSLF